MVAGPTCYRLHVYISSVSYFVNDYLLNRASEAVDHSVQMFTIGKGIQIERIATIYEVKFK